MYSLAALSTVVALMYLGRVEAADTKKTQLIDLGYTYNNKTLYWPNANTGFKMTYSMGRGFTAKGYWYQGEDISAPVHGGTHMDAPRHFAQTKWSIDEIPVENFIGAGSVIDVKDKAEGNPDYQLTKQDIMDWEAKHGSISSSIVLINFGWAKHYNNRTYYFGGPNGNLGTYGNDTSDLHCPGIHEDAARYIASKSPAVLGVGLDTASLDYGQSTTFMTHRVLFEKQIYGIENVRNLDSLPPRVDEVIVLPMDIEGSGGAPVRILARIHGAGDGTNTAQYSNLSTVLIIATILLRFM